MLSMATSATVTGLSISSPESRERGQVLEYIDSPGQLHNCWRLVLPTQLHPGGDDHTVLERSGYRIHGDGHQHGSQGSVFKAQELIIDVPSGRGSSGRLGAVTPT